MSKFISQSIDVNVRLLLEITNGLGNAGTFESGDFEWKLCLAR